MILYRAWTTTTAMMIWKVMNLEIYKGRTIVTMKKYPLALDRRRRN
jgi:hypothetical protein